MGVKRITELPEAPTLPPGAQFLLSQPSTTVVKTGATISFAAGDNSINDSASGFVVAGFVVGDQIRVTGAATADNNVVSASVVSVTAGKIVVNTALATEAAGASVTVAKWESRRIAASLIGGPGAPSVQRLTTAAMVTPLATNDVVHVTGQAGGLVIAPPSGTPVDGHRLTLRVMDNGTSRTLGWAAKYRPIGCTLPTSTTPWKEINVETMYNEWYDKWNVTSVVVEA